MDTMRRGLLLFVCELRYDTLLMVLWGVMWLWVVGCVWGVYVAIIAHDPLPPPPFALLLLRCGG